MKPVNIKSFSILIFFILSITVSSNAQLGFNREAYKYADSINISFKNISSTIQKYFLKNKITLAEYLLSYNKVNDFPVNVNVFSSDNRGVVELEYNIDNNQDQEVHIINQENETLIVIPTYYSILQTLNIFLQRVDNSTNYMYTREINDFLLEVRLKRNDTKEGIIFVAYQTSRSIELFNFATYVDSKNRSSVFENVDSKGGQEFKIGSSIGIDGTETIYGKVRRFFRIPEQF